MIPDHILIDDEHVDWAPREDVVPEHEYRDWMWMHAVDGADGERVYSGKHIDTRRYLRLDRLGRVYAEDHTGRPILLGLRADRPH